MVRYCRLEQEIICASQSMPKGLYRNVLFNFEKFFTTSKANAESFAEVGDKCFYFNDTEELLVSIFKVIGDDLSGQLGTVA